VSDEPVREKERRRRVRGTLVSAGVGSSLARWWRSELPSGVAASGFAPFLIRYEMISECLVVKEVADTKDEREIGTDLTGRGGVGGGARADGVCHVDVGARLVQELHNVLLADLGREVQQRVPRTLALEVKQHVGELNVAQNGAHEREVVALDREPRRVRVDDGDAVTPIQRQQLGGSEGLSLSAKPSP
jgi:hypothetical protein